MKKLLIGSILTLLDFELNIGSVSIDFLPDFIGWVFLMLGCRELTEYSDRFGHLRIVSAVMTAVSLAGFMEGFVNLGDTAGTVLGLLAAAGEIYGSYLLVKGISDTEDILRTDLGYMEMFRVFVIMVITLILSYATSFISYFAAICVIAHLVVCVIFLCQVFSSMRTYEKFISEME